MSHYKINERKCSTTLFPFDFVFLFDTRTVVMVMEAMTSSVFKASRNNSPFTIPGPGVGSVTLPSPSGTTAYLRFPSPPGPEFPSLAL